MPVPPPIAETQALECEETGAWEMSVFQMLSGGNMAQPPSIGTLPLGVPLVPVEPPPVVPEEELELLLDEDELEEELDEDELDEDEEELEDEALEPVELELLPWCQPEVAPEPVLDDAMLDDAALEALEVPVDPEALVDELAASTSPVLPLEDPAELVPPRWIGTPPVVAACPSAGSYGSRTWPGPHPTASAATAMSWTKRFMGLLRNFASH